MVSPTALYALAMLALSGLMLGCHVPGMDRFGSASKLRSPESVDLPEAASGLTQTEPSARLASAKTPGNQPIRSETEPAMMPTQPPALTAGTARGANPESRPAANADNLSARLKVSGVRPGQGPVRVAVFSEGSDFPNHEKAATTLTLPSKANLTEGSVDALPSGKFALAVYQDLNNDGKLNRSNFGLPMEPYGFSNNARGQFGPPSFQAAMLEAGQPSTTIAVALQ